MGGTNVLSVVDMTQNAWNHVAITHNNGDTRIFVNGVMSIHTTSVINLTTTNYLLLTMTLIKEI